MKKYRGLKYYHHPNEKPYLIYGDKLKIDKGYNEFQDDDGYIIHVGTGITNVEINDIRIEPKTLQYSEDGINFYNVFK